MKKGEPASQNLSFLAGMFPFTKEAMILPTVKMPSGIAADLHLFAAGEDFWLVCFDASEKYKIQQRQQQRGNDISLLVEKQETLLSQFLGNYFSKVLELKYHTPFVKRLNLTVVFADIRNFTFFSEKKLV